MIVFFNDNTLFAIAIGVACGLGTYSFSRSGSAAQLVGAISIIAFDPYIRLRNKDQEVPLLAPNEDHKT